MQLNWRRAAAALLCTAAFSACKFDITEYNPSGITADNVFASPEGFETLVNASYSYTRWWYGKEDGYSISEMGTDLWMGGNGDTHPTLTSYQNLGPTEAGVDLLWEKLYTAINLVNAGINRIDGAKYTDATRKKTRLGELRFLRAFYYWHIVETWGGVHFTTQETNGIQTDANRTPVDTFYKQIFDDLDFAVANLPTTTPDYGRITKGGAEAFLARMHLTRGNWQQALTASTNVINNYGYKLVPVYADLWKMSNLKNTEVVWAVNYSTTLALDDRVNPVLFPNGHPRGGHNGHLMFGQLYDREPGMIRDILNDRPFNRYMPTAFLLDLFDANDARFAGSFRDVWYANAPTRPAGMNMGDTAIWITKQTLTAAQKAGKIYRLYDRAAFYKADGSPVTRGQYIDLSKFNDPTRPTIAEEESGRDAFVIRLAEMYLIQAEANFRLNNTAAAAAALNVIRTRAALPGRTAAMQVTPAQITLDFILDERARELAGEQLRWFDLKRTGKLVDRVKASNPDGAPNVQAFHLVRPIPQRQIDAVANKTVFTQNPGYK